MKLFSFLVLALCFRCGFAQDLLKRNLNKDFAESSEKVYSLHHAWFAKDTLSIFTRDTIIFHNKPLYYLEAKNICKFLEWNFTSKTTISQSYYFPCVGHGYGTIAANGSGNYRFKIKESAGKIYLKLINFKYQTYWLEVSRSLEYDSRNIGYPVLTLVRLKHKPG